MSDALFEPFDRQRCRSLRTTLERWYAREGRVLPWRETSDPYRIWISEIMLQQTTVKAVIPFYERFLSRFPSVQDLATASEAEVLKYWEGLGYYSRGRNLRLAAQRICSESEGRFPSDLDALQRLPGIGRYTAGAIRSFGFNLPAPIVEANTLRLYCRLLGYTGDPRSQTGQGILWTFAEMLQPRQKAGHLNQALMELGSTICTPAAPKCEDCPLTGYCVAFQSGQQSTIPVKQQRPEVTQVVEATIAIRDGEKWLVRQRAPGERWAGMWDFPRFPLETLQPAEKLTKRSLSSVLREAMDRLKELCDVEVHNIEESMQIRHSVTRYRIRLLCLQAELNSRSRSSGELKAGLCWVSLDELKTMPMPITGRQFAERLSEKPQTLF
ncbi:A/G-specific adenine glycosylase [Planctomicrobium sp. SH661]|uniref:A/G-specific adenine glycosylase n=1 Tax=Planctomicrobium sp. SH661 TaxID=3448124 RepID=UPI003F5B5029